MRPMTPDESKWEDFVEQQEVDCCRIEKAVLAVEKAVLAVQKAMEARDATNDGS